MFLLCEAVAHLPARYCCQPFPFLPFDTTFTSFLPTVPLTRCFPMVCGSSTGFHSCGRGRDEHSQHHCSLFCRHWWHSALPLQNRYSSAPIARCQLQLSSCCPAFLFPTSAMQPGHSQQESGMLWSFLLRAGALSTFQCSLQVSQTSADCTDNRQHHLTL